MPAPSARREGRPFLQPHSGSALAAAQLPRADGLQRARRLAVRTRSLRPQRSLLCARRLEQATIVASRARINQAKSSTACASSAAPLEGWPGPARPEGGRRLAGRHRGASPRGSGEPGGSGLGAPRCGSRPPRHGSWRVSRKRRRYRLPPVAASPAAPNRRSHALQTGLAPCRRPPLERHGSAATRGHAAAPYFAGLLSFGLPGPGGDRRRPGRRRALAGEAIEVSHGGQAARLPDRPHRRLRHRRLPGSVRGCSRTPRRRRGRACAPVSAAGPPRSTTTPLPPRRGFRW